MEEKVSKIREEVDKFMVSSNEELEKFRIAFLGSKGAIKDLFADLKSVSNEQRREAGQLVNGLRQFVQDKFDTLKDQLENTSSEEGQLDLSRPGDAFAIGARHPLSLVRSEIIEIFNRIFRRNIRRETCKTRFSLKREIHHKRKWHFERIRHRFR